MLLAVAWAMVGATGSARAAGVGSGASVAGPQVVREDAARRTATSRTFVLSDGSRQTRVWADPVNYKTAAGSWSPIDTRLKGDGQGGLQSTAGDTDVALPPSLDEPVSVSDEADRSVSFTLLGADVASEASATGSKAVYADVRPGVDVAYQALTAGLKETLVLTSSAAPSSYTFSIGHSTGLAAALRSDGSLVFTDAGGTVRFSVPSPTVQDADAAAPTAAHVSFDLSDDHRTLTLRVDPVWLSSARFPVKVDPTVYSSDQDSCTLQDGSLASSPGLRKLDVACGQRVRARAARSAAFERSCFDGGSRVMRRSCTPQSDFTWSR